VLTSLAARNCPSEAGNYKIADNLHVRPADVATITTSRDEPAPIAKASFRIAAGSRCGTFSQAELTAELVIRRIQV